MFLPILTSLVVFAAVACAVIALFRDPVPAEPPVQRRVARSLGVDHETIFENVALAPILNPAVGLAGRINLPALRKRVRQDLSASGNAAGYSVDQYIALCLVCATAGGFAGAVIGEWMASGLLLLGLPAGAAIGFYAPLSALRGAATKRTQRIAKQVPYTLDLIALVMAAGSSFTEAVETLIRDNPDDDLNQELRLMLSEIEFGATRAQAMVNLADRIPLESLRSVVASVNQAERLGTPLSDILKMQADTLRMHRSVRAEKLSASASLRILIPSMLILLAVVIVVFAPMAMRFVLRGGLL